MSDVKLNILVAYPYMKPDVIKILKEHEGEIRFLLDSGAFTAWKSGKPIQLDDYCRFIESLPIKPWRYFNLDVIGNGEASFKNYEIMRSRGFNPVPIFTRGENIQMLDEYYKTSDVVGIGGLVGTRGNKGFVKGIMNVVGNRKVHWLGFTDLNYVMHYKPYMCDSSSFDSGLRFGFLKIFYNKKFYKFNKKDFSVKPSDLFFEICSFYKEDPYGFSKKETWKNTGTYKTAFERIIYKSALNFSNEFSKSFNTYYFNACVCAWKIKCLIFSKKELSL